MAPPRNSARSLRQDFCPNSKFGKRRNTVCISACQKSLAEFAARRRQRDSDHFLSGRVPDRKYNSGCKCAICTPKAYKSCARQTAILLSKKGKALFRQSRILYVFLVFQTEEVGQKDGGDSQTQLCGGAVDSLTGIVVQHTAKQHRFKCVIAVLLCHTKRSKAVGTVVHSTHVKSDHMIFRRNAEINLRLALFSRSRISTFLYHPGVKFSARNLRRLASYFGRNPVNRNPSASIFRFQSFGVISNLPLHAVPESDNSPIFLGAKQKTTIKIFIQKNSFPKNRSIQHIHRKALILQRNDMGKLCLIKFSHTQVRPSPPPA